MRDDFSFYFHGLAIRNCLLVFYVFIAFDFSLRLLGCGGYFTVTRNDQLIINSPGWPGYSKYTACTWNISSTESDEDLGLKIWFTQFHLLKIYDSCYDYVRVVVDNVWSADLCGKTVQDKVYKAKRDLAIIFKKEARGAYRGFHAEVDVCK